VDDRKEHRMGLITLDLNSEARQQHSAFSPEPPSPLPRIWIGFLLAFGFLVAEVIEAAQGNTDTMGPLTLAASLLGSVYWFFCIHRFHKILGQLSPQVDGEPTYPITPKQAVGYHFVPFYNLFWLFRWPGQLKDFLEKYFSIRLASAAGLGTILLLSMLIMRVVDGFIGLTLLFAVALYISRKLRQAIAERVETLGSVGVFA
jgi:hypothetical protein